MQNSKRPQRKKEKNLECSELIVYIHYYYLSLTNLSKVIKVKESLTHLLHILKLNKHTILNKYFYNLKKYLDIDFLRSYTFFLLHVFQC